MVELRSKGLWLCLSILLSPHVEKAALTAYHHTHIHIHTQNATARHAYSLLRRHATGRPE
jgi:hypothetical protein